MSDNTYIEQNVPLFEAIYGKGLISLGGVHAIDSMFLNIDLAHKTVLDIGSGIGGMAYHLAEQYHCTVIGLEIQEWMADYAIAHAPFNIKNALQFITYSPKGSIPLNNKSVDICCSKGVLTNVKEKLSLFQECHRVLKNKGNLVLIDWLVPESLGQKQERLRLGDMSFKEPPSGYLQILHTAGFHNVQFLDKSKEYLEYVKKLDKLYHSQAHKNAFSHIISDSLREDLIQANNDLAQAIESDQQLSMLILANQ